VIAALEQEDRSGAWHGRGIELLDRSRKRRVLPGRVGTNERHPKELLEQHHNRPV
jgi:hypothetical protein